MGKGPDKLIKGFGEKLEKKSDTEKALAKDLYVNGQTPDIAMIYCCDSRYDAVDALNAKAGDIFSKEDIIGFVPPYVEGELSGIAAWLDCAVNFLKVKDVVMMGHTKCEGIARLVGGIDDDHPLGFWINQAKEALDRVKAKGGYKNDGEFIALVERESIIWSLENLKTYPFVKKALENGDLHIHGWQIEFNDSGVEILHAYDQKTNKFEVLAGVKAGSHAYNGDCCGADSKPNNPDIHL